jgi:hypothetical protein
VALKKNIWKKIRNALIIFVLAVIVINGVLFILAYRYREYLAARLIEESRNRYGIEFTYDKMGMAIAETWPQVSFRFKNVVLTSLHENPNKKPLLIASDVFFCFNAMELLQKKFAVENVVIKKGKIMLEIDSTGQKNFRFRSSEANPATESFLTIHQILLHDMDFDFSNHKKHKRIAMFFKRNSIDLQWINNNTIGTMRAKTNIAELMFKEKNGPMFENKDADLSFRFIFLKSRKKLFIDQSSFAVIDDQKYDLKGLVHMDSLQQMDLEVRADVKDFQHTIALLYARARHNLRYIQVKNPIRANLFLTVKFHSDDDPQLKLTFSGNNNWALIGSEHIPYKNLKFEGEMLCLPAADGVHMHNAIVKINKLRGTIYGFPFKGKLTVKDMIHPYLTVDAFATIDSKNLKSNPGKDFDLSGYCYAKIHYEGPADKTAKSTFLDPPMKLRANLNIDSVTYRTKPSQLPFVLYGKVDIANKQARFKNLLLKTIGGDFYLNGVADGFTAYLYSMQKGFRANVEINSPDFDLTPLIERVVPKVEKAAPEETVNKGKGIAERLSQNDFEFNIKMKMKKVKFRKLGASDALASIYYEDDVINLRKLQMQTCGGEVSVSGYLYNYTKANAHVYFKNVDVNELFNEAENFGQQALKSENLAGALSASANVAIEFSEHFKPNMSTLALDAESVLKEGHLIHYEPFEKISDYIFRKRNFSDITFTEMRPTFTIRGTEMKLDTMEIASSVMNVFVSGTYNFRGESNFNFIVPWSNLKSRKKDFAPHKLVADGEVSRGLKLNLHGYPHEMKLRLGNKP